MRMFPCPCCGSPKAVLEHKIGAHGICSECGWVDDGYQRQYPDEPGANRKMTLKEAQQAWADGKTLYRQYPNPKSE